MKRVICLVLLTLFSGCKEKKQPDATLELLPAPARVDGADSTSSDSGSERPAVEDRGGSPGCHKGEPWACAVEAAIAKETNSLREKPLALGKEASYVARKWSLEQASRSKIGHEGFTGERTAALKAEFPSLKIAFRAENVAMTQSRDDSPEKLAKTFVTMWKNSEGHRKNMLGNYRSIGIGVAREGRAFYATQIFY